ncbi:MAG: hypothetical protein QOK40_1799 [Miltoncostaeaceae bacterium]|jgi:hypothetical protein|nr:hypothetical protein [Miltoncostaeaceae bacterium]
MIEGIRYVRAACPPDRTPTPTIPKSPVHAGR